eukprot:TRINITY_DN3605_c0_g1_i3.p1 TRINITY_DN3605_c0_g1~~TRINITY_DN3605_c0_g1_i3.p1  ORF type:complete len:274 (+),score=65.02 TRINITY_DN3605_c0_g1_i3:36-824(+)
MCIRDRRRVYQMKITNKNLISRKQDYQKHLENNFRSHPTKMVRSSLVSTFTRAALILALLVLGSKALLVTLAPGAEEYCFITSMEKGFNLTGSYVVSGENEEFIQFQIIDQNGDVIVAHLNQRENEFAHEIFEEGKYKLCFELLDYSTKVVSFDFSVFESHYKKFAQADSIQAIHQDVKRAYKQLEVIYRNQHFQQTREETHRKVLRDTEQRVKSCGIVKVLALIIITIGQVYVLTGFFKNCLLYTSPSPRDGLLSRMPSSA